MKKYISLLTIATAFITLSCERSDIEKDQNLKNSEKINHEIQSKLDSIHQADPVYDEGYPTNVEPGGDDEPERDKQHWRIIIKS